MKQWIFNRVNTLLLLGFSLLLLACNKSPKYDFATPQEALNACSEKLSDLNGKDKADIEELTEIVVDWMALQDSAYTKFVNDTTAKLTGRFADEIFNVSDSIRDEIMRIALAQPRTMTDVLYLKINTCNRDKQQNTKIYQEARSFYDSLDGSNVYEKSKTLGNYHHLLRNAQSFKKEKDVLDFIREEDKCFRSLMAYLTSIPQDELQNITDETADIFNGLAQSILRSDVGQQERMRVYLTMRFNRRMVQNAMVCRSDIKRNIKLNELQLANYRWMIIQPFFSIDNDAMALITPSQENQLNELAKDLPSLLTYIDKTQSKTTQEESSKLSKVLVEYFLKSYLRLNDLI